MLIRSSFAVMEAHPCNNTLHPGEFYGLCLGKISTADSLFPRLPAVANGIHPSGQWVWATALVAGGMLTGLAENLLLPEKVSAVVGGYFYCCIVCLG